MKHPLIIPPVFAPGAAGAGTLSFAAQPAFDLSRLLAVLNVTRNAPIYGIAQAGIGGASYNSGSKTLTLQTDTSTHLTGDTLHCIYDYPVLTHRHVSTASTNAIVISSVPSLLVSAYLSVFKYFPSNSNGMLAIYEKSTTPTPGTDTPKLSMHYAHLDYTHAYHLSPSSPIHFSNGIAITITLDGTTYAATSANAITSQIIYSA